MLCHLIIQKLLYWFLSDFMLELLFIYPIYVMLLISEHCSHDSVEAVTRGTCQNCYAVPTFVGLIFLKYLLALWLTFFRVPLFIYLGFCNRFSSASLLWSNNIEHYLPNHRWVNGWLIYIAALWHVSNLCF
jgi:hypothetical protein